jgi:hypothetical protein
MGMAQLQAQLGKLQEHIIRNLLKDPFLCKGAEHEWYRFTTLGALEG